jgi:hypothetical protein
MNNAKMGRPRIFETPQEIEDLFVEFLAKCTKEESVPTIVGFTIHARISRETYYAYQRNAEFTDTIKRIDELLEECSLQGMFKARNPVAFIFYLKNKFGYSDKVVVENTQTIQHQLPQMQAEILKLEEELRVLEALEVGECEE